MRNVTPLAVFATVSLITACAAKSHPAAETVMSGSAALSTFPNAPTQVRAVDETGAARMVPISADGTFTLTLPHGHAYKVTLAGQANVPMVFPRTTGALDTTFTIKSKGAKVALGTVRYIPNAPSSGFVVSAPSASGGKHDGEIEDDETSSCDDGSVGGGKGAPEADTPDNRADATKEMAVGQRNAPNEVDGCDSENENDGESKD